MKDTRTPFHRPHLTGQENIYIAKALESRQIAGGGDFSQRCQTLLEAQTGAARVLLTNSCTSALEMACVLADLQPGDEVIMPAFTFTSTANACVLRGAVPVFVDIQPQDLNIDPARVEQAITSKTRAIMPVHYAGLACDMHAITEIANRHQLLIIEDAAQGIGARHRGAALGSIGQMGAISFHNTKNLSCGEGGALLINDPALLQRAEIVHDKGTNRAHYREGLIRQYTWVDVGMSAPPSELTAAMLLAQLEAATQITAARLAIWQRYHECLSMLASQGKLRLAHPAPWQQHNAHIFWVIFHTTQDRNRAKSMLADAGIETALHFQPLHQSPAGQQLGRASDPLLHAEALPDRLLRMPLWPGLANDVPERIGDILKKI